MLLVNKLKEIDEIVINNDKEKLDLKLNLINQLLDLAENSVNEEDVSESLKRVYWLSYEVGSNKAFESSNLELNLVNKALKLARKRFLNNKRELLIYLKLNLTYSLNDKHKSNQLLTEIAEIEKSL